MPQMKPSNWLILFMLLNLILLFMNINNYYLKTNMNIKLLNKNNLMKNNKYWKW